MDQISALIKELAEVNKQIWALPDDVEHPWAYDTGGQPPRAANTS